MIKINSILKEDMESILKSNLININKFCKKTVVITGATGFLGSLLAKTLIYANELYNLNISVICLVRNSEKAKTVFRGFDSSNLIIKQCDLMSKEDISQVLIKHSINYVFHFASPTSGAYFVEHPVETINFGYTSTKLLLDYCKNCPIDSFVYLSSMEAYGECDKEATLNEDSPSYIDASNPRDSYSEMKRVCECLCSSYYRQYGVSANSIRLAQCFGAGMPNTDNRYLSYIVKSILLNKDIVLNTSGESKHSFVYSADAIIAILLVALSEKSGEVYNVGNEKTYMSMLELAQKFCSICAVNTKVVIKNNDQGVYPKTNFLNLDSSKIFNLGFEFKFNDDNMFKRFYEYCKDSF